MPYYPIVDQDYFIPYAFVDNGKIVGYTYCYDIALQISWETKWKVINVCKHHIIDKNIPILEWSETEQEKPEECCVIL